MDKEQSPAPDFLQRIEGEADSSLHPLLEKIMNNLKLIGLIIGLVVLIAGGISGYKLYDNHRMNQASSEFADILSEQDPEVRAQALKNFSQSAPAGLSTGINLELAQALMQNKDYQQAADKFAELKSADKDLKAMAVLGQAKALQLANKYEKALALLEKNKDDIFEGYSRPLINMIAFSAEQSQNWQKALSAYQELKEKNGMGQGQDETAFFDYKIKEMQEKMAG